MIVLWLSLVTAVQCLISVDDSVEAEYSLASDAESTALDNFVIFTVATEANDPYMRFVRSLKVFGMDQYLQVLQIIETIEKSISVRKSELF